MSAALPVIAHETESLPSGVEADIRSGEILLTDWNRMESVILTLADLEALYRKIVTKAE
jgi:hypothetical protein